MFFFYCYIFFCLLLLYNEQTKLIEKNNGAYIVMNNWNIINLIRNGALLKVVFVFKSICFSPEHVKIIS